MCLNAFKCLELGLRLYFYREKLCILLIFNHFILNSYLLQLLICFNTYASSDTYFLNECCSKIRKVLHITLRRKSQKMTNSKILKKATTDFEKVQYKHPSL